MSGQAAALTAPKDRGHFANQISFPTTLRESLSAERPPSLLDFYLSWMSPGFGFHSLDIPIYRTRLNQSLFPSISLHFFCNTHQTLCRNQNTEPCCPQKK